MNRQAAMNIARCPDPHVQLADLQEMLPQCYASLPAALAWVFLTRDPALELLLDYIEEQDRLVDQLSDLGVIPEPRLDNNYGDRSQWVVERLDSLAGPDCHPALRRFRELHEARFRFLPARH